MKKIIFLLLIFTIFSLNAYSCSFLKKTNNNENIITAPLFKTKLSNKNTVWVGTFQLLWNDLSNNIIDGPVIFSNGQISLAEELNKQEFNNSMLSENYFYATHGYMTKSFKKEIEKTLKEKFNDKSDILDSLEWNDNNFLLYTILKKDFEFISSFDELKNEKFGESDTLVKYFGFKDNKYNELRDSIRVMFYNSENDFAVKINTKGKDKVILYRTDKQTSFENIYDDFLDKSRTYEESKNFQNKDNLKIPYISFATQHSYKELVGKHIKGTDMVIDTALQTVKFKMDNKGIKLKSEAAMMNKMMMPIPDTTKPRDFYFNDTFILFLIERDKPYFALRITDVNKLNK